LEADYPAAHSMDTEWFAVDADGSVALFDSGEAGAVPASFLDAIGEQYNLWSFLDSWQVASDGTRHVVGDAGQWRLGTGTREVQSAIEQAIERVGEVHFRSQWADGTRQAHRFGSLATQSCYNLVMVLRHEAALSRLRHVQYALRFSGVPLAVFVDECSVQCVKDLLESGELIEGRFVDSIAEAPRLIGAYGFRHGARHENWISGPYERTHVPARSLRLEDVPPALLQTVTTVRFDALRFSELAAIQPVEQTPCQSRQLEWIGTDGQLRRFPPPAG
jgi:hypothetical protein